jgi:hypothetical protein
MTRIIRTVVGPGPIVVFAALGLWMSPAGWQGGTAGPAPATVLSDIGLSAQDIAVVERGEAVARVLDTDRRQVAVVGAVRINGPRASLVQRFRTVDYLKSGSAVLDAGQLGDPPRPSDLNGVPFEPYDLDLRDCRPGDCRVRLSDADIARFQREVQWSRPDWQAQSAAIWRDILGSVASGYVRAGASALPVFANKEARLPVADELAVLLKESQFLRSLAPGMLEHLRNPARNGLPRSEALLYWSKEDFGIRPVLRLTYQAIHGPEPSAAAPEPPVVIASTQLYAAHYLDAAVGFLIAMRAPGRDGGDGFYLIAVNRARTRSLSSFTRRLVRSTVQKRSRSSLEKVLLSAKAALEGNRTLGPR